MKNSETRVDLSVKSDEVPTYCDEKKKMKKCVHCAFAAPFAQNISVFKNEMLTLKQVLSFGVNYVYTGHSTHTYCTISYWLFAQLPTVGNKKIKG